jgi:hypothetical protein
MGEGDIVEGLGKLEMLQVLDDMRCDWMEVLQPPRTKAREQKARELVPSSGSFALLKHLPSVAVRLTPGSALDLHPTGVLARTVGLIA